MTFKVLLVDDEPLVRVTLLRGFSSQADFEVVGQASDGEEAVRLAQSLSPDVIVMDVQMPKLSGLEATRRLRHAGIVTPVVFLTAGSTTAVQTDGLGNVEVLLKAESGIVQTIRVARAAAVVAANSGA